MTEKTRIELTGNPFVDTGLGAIACLADIDVNDLTLSHLYQVYGNGDQLTRWNSKLKSFTQIFGTNNPLYQSSYGFSKGKGPSIANQTIYKKTLEGLLSEIGKEAKGERCWACGKPSDFDFTTIYKKAVETSNKKAPESKLIGRDWFPLAGSLGSDAQSLPAASKPPNICPKCLFAVHYLPISLILLNGRLAVFQSTSQEFWYELIQNLVKTNQKQIETGNYETSGAKEGSRVFMARLLALFEQLQREPCHDVPEALYVWRFTNSGASPDCVYEEIPNFALSFLQEAVDKGLQYDIACLLAFEDKRSQYSLYQSILDRRDYFNLYPEGKRRGASPKLYTLYQMRILNHSVKALSTAHKLARTIIEKTNPGDSKRILRREAFRENSYRNQARATIARMAAEGELTIEDYSNLFPPKEGRGIAVEWTGWNIIRFFLHHTTEEFPEIVAENRSTEKMNPFLLYFAGQIYDYYLNETKRGKNWFQARIMEQINRRINARWLMDQFTQLAEKQAHFTYEKWEDLCKWDDGEIHVSELIFQMRLLWSQWIHENKDIVVLPKIENKSVSGLPERIEKLTEIVFADYIKRRGLERFHRDVLLPLRRKEIGEYWLKEKLTGRISEGVPSLMEEEWNDFLIDEHGKSIRTERVFQLHLFFANLFRVNSIK